MSCRSTDKKFAESKGKLKACTWVVFVAVARRHWCGMKVLQVLVVAVAAVLNIGAATPLKPFPFKIREVSNNSFSEGPQLRIYGGMEAPEEKFPFMIFVLMKIPGGRLSQCSASLVKPDWVLLAAHCVSFPGLRPEDIIVVGGKANLAPYIIERLCTEFYTTINEVKLGVQERRVKQFVTHPKYNTEILVHDVALLQLHKPFDLGSVKLIPLSEEQMKEKKRCTILGWGLTAGNKQTYKLNYAENRMVSTTKIGCSFKENGPFICLLPDDRKICQGDSGSPLVCDDKVWGVASHFVTRSQFPDCGDSLEEYYSEVHKDLDWIRSVYNNGNLSSAISLKSVLVSVFVGLWLSAKR